MGLGRVTERTRKRCAWRPRAGGAVHESQHLPGAPCDGAGGSTRRSRRSARSGASRWAAIRAAAGPSCASCPASLEATACQGETIPGGLAKVVSRGCLLAATAAEQSDRRRSRRSLHGAAKQLSVALRYLRLARRRTTLSDGCIDALEGLLQAPVDRAGQLLHEP